MTVAAAASGTPAYLTDVVGMVAVAAVIGYVCVRVRVVPILGFLLAGVLVGPDALGIVQEREVVDAAAEIGVILLLFTIGIEFSLARLAAIRRVVLLGGTLQVGLCVAAVAGICLLLDVGWEAALFTGLVVSLSSTALVLKLLADRGATGTATGRTAVGLLIFQDLAVVAMVLLVPVLGVSGGGVGTLVRAVVTSAVVIAVTLLVARRLMPPLLEAVARACSPEVFLLSVIALCLGTAWLTSLAGVSVSLGAFLAGLVVSESRHSAHALGEILPLQILFSAVFFLSVGTLLDLRFLVEEPLLVLAAVTLAVVVKAVTTTVAARAVGLRLTTAASVGLLLAQVGEFAFVLERVGAAEGLSPGGLGERGSQAFLAATVVLLLLTPALAAAGRAVDARSQPRGRHAAVVRPVVSPVDAGEVDVLVSGWGEHARALVPQLLQLGHRPAVVTLSPDGAAEAEAGGIPTVRGDSTRATVLREARVDLARVVVVADDEPHQAGLIAGVVGTVAPRSQVVALAPDASAVPGLHDAGVRTVVLAGDGAVDRLTTAVADLLRGPARPGRIVADTTSVVEFRPHPDSACAHTRMVRPVVPRTRGCEECERTGTDWVHLRLCVTCGHVGCCDSSPGKHAAAHASAAGHPVMCSVEPGEGWGWCYLDSTLLPEADPSPRRS